MNDDSVIGVNLPYPFHPCPQCQSTRRQAPWGRTRSGSPKQRCSECGKVYVAHPKSRGYSSEIRREAVRMALDGVNLREIGQRLSVSHQSVANWVHDYQRQHPQTMQTRESISS